MSLNDVDKSGVSRNNPTINSDDSVASRMAHGTAQNHNAGEEPSADGLKFFERQILAKQGGFNKAVFGFYGESNKFGLRVAKDGYDVLSASNDQLIVNSDQNMLKVVDSIDVNFSAASASTTTGFDQDDVAGDVFPHGLGYTPVVVPGGGNSGFVNSPQIFGGSDYIGFGAYLAFADEENIYCYTRVNVHANAVGARGVTLTAITVKLYLLQETAQ